MLCDHCTRSCRHSFTCAIKEHASPFACSALQPPPPPFALALACSALFLSALALPCPALSCPLQPCPDLPCPDLPSPALPCPALPSPALPCPALPCPPPLLSMSQWWCRWHDRLTAARRGQYCSHAMAVTRALLPPHCCSHQQVHCAHI